MADEQILVEVKGLKMYFPVTRGIIIERKVADIKAVDNVSFYIRRGETFGLVGESGCGKTTAGRCILQLYKPTEGVVNYWDEELKGYTDLVKLKGETLRKMRRKIQIIFQDPYGSLNPRMSCGAIVGEPLKIHGLARGREYQERVDELLSIVGLDPYFASRYPPG